MLSRVIYSVVALSALAVAMAQSSPSDMGHGKTGSHHPHKRAPKGRGGRATWYIPGLGNCGGYSKYSDMIVALPTSVYAGGKYCGKRIKITNTKNGKTTYAKIVDSCPGCGGNDLDVAPKVFTAISKSLDDGVATINWDFA
ncbi:putative effector protein [Ceratobasidium theobromae]|uniref:Putative effector protein n=1 Tax=Ceratobasidium theobromae TaxID=1582974 RepID=A0A5N5QSC1_9AGAM|nr:putative effector protein [Ceratobasidium theobromae]